MPAPFAGNTAMVGLAESAMKDTAPIQKGFNNMSLHLSVLSPVGNDEKGPTDRT